MEEPQGKDVLVRHVYGNVYDAFWGKGWLNWTRFLYKRSEITYIKGQYINKADMLILKGALKALEAMPVDG